MKDKYPSYLKVKSNRSSLQWQTYICFRLVFKGFMKKNSGNKNTKFSRKSLVRKLKLDILTFPRHPKPLLQKTTIAACSPREKVIFLWGMKMPGYHALKREGTINPNSYCYCFMVHPRLLSGFYEYRQ